jgi:hypothetical protein
LTNQGVDARGIAFHRQHRLQRFSLATAGSSNRRRASSSPRWWSIRSSLRGTFNQTGTGPSYPNTTKINDIYSTLGRLSIRAGTTIVGDKMIWQPFATVSVYREFAGQADGDLHG